MSGSSRWRVFPWDVRAGRGQPFAPDWIPRPTGRGRFDLPSRQARVLYVAETPEHAVAELLHPWSGRSIDERHLVRSRHPLALVEVGISLAGVADLCDPLVLVRLGVAPDRVASRDRSVTQGIAHTVRSAGHAGLRWWSRFHGDWHTLVLFMRPGDEGEEPAEPVFGQPVPLHLDSPAVIEAARALGIELSG